MNVLDLSVHSRTSGTVALGQIGQVAFGDHVWPGGAMVKALELRFKGRRSDPWPFRFHVTILDKLFTQNARYQAESSANGQR